MNTTEERLIYQHLTLILHYVTSIQSGEQIIIRDLDNLRKALHHMATETEQLKQAVADLNSSFITEVAAIQAKLQELISANPSGVSKADADEVIASLGDLKSRMDQETTALAPAVNPNPPATTT